MHQITESALESLGASIIEPMCSSYWNWGALEPGFSMKSSPCSLQLEKSSCSKEDPSQPKVNNFFFFEKKASGWVHHAARVRESLVSDSNLQQSREGYLTVCTSWPWCLSGTVSGTKLAFWESILNEWMILFIWTIKGQMILSPKPGVQSLQKADFNLKPVNPCSWSSRCPAAWELSCWDAEPKWTPSQ